jgi:ATP-dependent RNA helicase DDX46/PRP5
VEKQSAERKEDPAPQVSLGVVLCTERLITDFKTQQEAAEARQAALDDAEEKIRQRRERIEQWRREKALKEAQEKAAQEEQQQQKQDQENAKKGASWNLDDDEEEEEEGEITTPADSTSNSGPSEASECES